MMENRERPAEIFESKKNHVEKIRLEKEQIFMKYVVRKKYFDTAAWAREKRVLTILKEGNCAVPQILREEKDLLIMEYIEGELMVEMVLDPFSGIVQKLVDTLQEIYSVLRKWDGEHQWILGDMNLRNFLYHKQEARIYRVDLESLRKGSIVEDLGEFLAFYITYDPAFTVHKQEMTRWMLSEFIVAFDIEEEKLKKEYNLALKKLKKRRRMKKYSYSGV